MKTVNVERPVLDFCAILICLRFQGQSDELEDQTLVVSLVEKLNAAIAAADPETSMAVVEFDVGRATESQQAAMLTSISQALSESLAELVEEMYAQDLGESTKAISFEDIASQN